jgi:hypothetical protein
VDDTLRWAWEASGSYFACSCYAAIFGECVAILGELHIWKSCSLESYKVFLWLSIKKKCWTADKLGWHGLQHLAACLVCEQDDETLDHLLMGCVHSCEI